MITKKYAEYLRSKEWTDLKIDLITARGQKCEKCGNQKKSPTQLQVHHITYKNIFNESPEDLMILCSYCHRLEHGLVKKKSKKKVNSKVKSKKSIKSKFKAIDKKESNWSKNQNWAKFNAFSKKHTSP